MILIPEAEHPDILLQDLMQRIDVSEALLRFGHLDGGLGVRNAFGQPETTTPDPPPAFR